MSIGGADLSIQGRIEIDLISHGMEAAANSLKAVQVQAQAAGKSLRSAGESFAQVGQKAKGIGQSLSVGVTAPLVGLAGIAIKSASDLNESLSAVNSSFGESAKAVVDFSKTSAEALGISQQATLQSAVEFGALFQATGSSAQQAADFSQKMITASADIASYFNVQGGAATVAEGFRAALTGEGDALKKWGIIVDEASVQAELARTGQDKLTGSQLAAAKVQARYNLILAQMGAAEGDQARTKDQLAGKTRTVQAQIQNLAATIGTQFLPYVLRAVNELSILVKRFTELPQRTKNIILAFIGIAAVAGPLLIVFGSIASAIGALLPVFGLLLGPIGLIILALVGLGIAYKTNFLGFGDAVRVVGKVLGVFVNYIKAVNADGDLLNDWLSHLPGPLQAVAKLFGRLLNAFKKVSSGFVEMIRDLFAGDFSGAFQQFRKVLAGLGDALSAPAKFIGEFLKSIHTGFAPLDKLIHGIGGLWISFGRIIQEVFQGDFKGALVVGERFLRQFQAVALEAFHLLWIGIVALARAIAGLPWAAIFGAIGHAIAVVFSRAFDWLKGSGVALIWGLLVGAIEKLPDLLKWLGGLAVTIAPYLADAAKWLWQNGWDLMQGLADGIGAGFPKLVVWSLNWIADNVPGYMADAASWLWNAGWDVMKGLALGIYQGFKDNVVGALDWVTKQIPEWKGPRAKDLRLLYDSGQVVMQGFEAGLMSGFAGVKSTLGTMTQQLAPAVTTAPTPRLAPMTAGARTVQAGGVTINVSGAGDPEAVAQAVYRSLDAAFGRLELEVRR
jgi:hypothetical protein